MAGGPLLARKDRERGSGPTPNPEEVESIYIRVREDSDLREQEDGVAMLGSNPNRREAGSVGMEYSGVTAPTL